MKLRTQLLALFMTLAVLALLASAYVVFRLDGVNRELMETRLAVEGHNRAVAQMVLAIQRINLDVVEYLNDHAAYRSLELAP
ncbi:MAG TPA: hypothetical protein PKM88_14820 [bacterium]|nr:hypothetical protein [bacterium]